MVDPDLLTQVFSVKIEPAIALHSSLIETMKFNSKALLTVTGLTKFQIKAPIPDHPAALSLEMESDYIFPISKSECLLFPLDDWYQQLKNLIIDQPSAAMYINKTPGSTDVHCLFGLETIDAVTYMGEDGHYIELGKAEFVKRERVYRYNFLSDVIVTMEAVQFREFIQDFSSKHDHSVSAIQFLITETTLSFLTPGADFDHPAEKYVVEGLQPGDNYQFAMRWDCALFEMLCSAAIGCDEVELSVVGNSMEVKFYRFWFLSTGQRLRCIISAMLRKYHHPNEVSLVIVELILLNCEVHIL